MERENNYNKYYMKWRNGMDILSTKILQNPFYHYHNAEDFISETPPWFDLKKWMNFIKSKGIILTEGDRNNKTDGEIHYFLKRGDDVFELKSNCWDFRSRGWQESIDWVNKDCECPQK